MLVSQFSTTLPNVFLTESATHAWLKGTERKGDVAWVFHYSHTAFPAAVTNVFCLKTFKEAISIQAVVF